MIYNCSPRNGHLTVQNIEIASYTSGLPQSRIIDAWLWLIQVPYLSCLIDSQGLCYEGQVPFRVRDFGKDGKLGCFNLGTGGIRRWKLKTSFCMSCKLLDRWCWHPKPLNKISDLLQDGILFVRFEEFKMEFSWLQSSSNHLKTSRSPYLASVLAINQCPLPFAFRCHKAKERTALTLTANVSSLWLCPDICVDSSSLLQCSSSPGTWIDNMSVKRWNKIRAEHASLRWILLSHC